MPVFGNDLDVQVVELNVRIGIFDANGCRYHPVPDAVQRFYQSRHAGGCFEMSKIALHRADKERAIFGTALAQRIAYGSRFNRVADGRTGAVSFDVVDCLPDRCRPGRKPAPEEPPGSLGWALSGRICGHPC